MPGSENSTGIMFFYVYVLQSEVSRSLYVGYTTDLDDRLQEHNRGSNFSTKSDKPWKLIYYEAFGNRLDAKRREKYLKTNQGSRTIKIMLKEYFYYQKSRSKN